MSRAIKWRMQFKSLNEVGCLVNIYKTNATSSADESKTGADVPFAVESGVTELIGADTPFSYDEDDSTNLLEPIRYKTGFIRVLEETFGALDSLQPSTETEHYVEVFYGSERVFTGYMQCAEYSNNWCAAPRILEFPVTSPLGLLSSFNFSVPSEPGITTIGALMKEVIQGLNASYTKVIYPGQTYDPWNNIIHTTVVVPFNGQFAPTSQALDLYSPRDYQFFVEGLAACRGCVVHDTPDAIVFSRFDQGTNAGENYSRINVMNLDNPSGRVSMDQDANAFNYYFPIAEDRATQTVVRPLKELVLNIEGEKISEQNLNIDHCKNYVGGTVSFTGGHAQRFELVGNEVDGEGIGVASFSSSGELQDYGLFPVAYGTYGNNDVSFSYDKFWVTRYKQAWANGTKLMSCKFFGCLAFSPVLLKMRLELGTSMKNLKPTSWGRDVVFNVSIKVGDYYIRLNSGGTQTWDTSLILNSMTFRQATGSVTPNYSLSDYPYYADVDGIIFTPRRLGSTEVFNPVIEVAIYKSASTQLDQDGYLIKYAEISLQSPDAEYEEYRIETAPRDLVIKGSNKGVDTDELDIPMSDWAAYRGDRSFAQADGSMPKQHGSYLYMFSPQKWLQIVSKKAHDIRSATNEYIAKFTNGTKRMRLVSHGFDLINDNHTIQWAESQTIQ